MNHLTDTKIVDVALYFLPVRCEVPLGFGSETVETVTCARAAVTLTDSSGKRATGWGETPLNVQWAWPGTDAQAPALGERERIIKEAAVLIANRLRTFTVSGHPLEITTRFMADVLPEVVAVAPGIPKLAATLCMAAFDLALYDAFGRVHGVGVFDTFTDSFMNDDLGRYLSDRRFAGRYPAQYFRAPITRMPVWHMVGCHDLLRAEDVGESGADGEDPDNDALSSKQNRALPRSLQQWVQRDQISLIKVKLRGCDGTADIDRIVDVASAVGMLNADGDQSDFTLSIDLNRTAADAGYVHGLFDALERDVPRVWKRLLYVEEPLQPRLVGDATAVTSLARRKPLFMDESVVHWSDLTWGWDVGWTGAALKTCKTLSGSLLSLCWAREHDMPVMVQDLTNPMLAQLTHLSFASRVPTLCGVESNAMQFYPRASESEAAVHPGAYRRSGGTLDISTLGGPGFGYRIEEMKRELPPRVA